MSAVLEEDLRVTLVIEVIDVRSTVDLYFVTAHITKYFNEAHNSEDHVKISASTPVVRHVNWDVLNVTMLAWPWQQLSQ